jgi:hypothetical protein
MKDLTTQLACFDQTTTDPGPALIIEDLDEFAMGRTSTCLCWAGQPE